MMVLHWLQAITVMQNEFHMRYKARASVRRQQQKEVRERVKERRRERKRQGLTPDPLPGEVAEQPGEFRWKSPTE